MPHQMENHEGGCCCSRAQVALRRWASPAHYGFMGGFQRQALGSDVNRIEIGPFVRDRLDAVSAINKLQIHEFDLFVLRNFLRDEECEALVRIFKTDRKPSRLMSDNPDPHFRTSETCNLPSNNHAVRGVEAKLTALLGMNPRHGEILQGQRYAVGQQFKPHHDYLRTTEAYCLSRKR